LTSDDEYILLKMIEPISNNVEATTCYCVIVLHVLFLQLKYLYCHIKIKTTLH